MHGVFVVLMLGIAGPFGNSGPVPDWASDSFFDTLADPETAWPSQAFVGAIVDWYDFLPAPLKPKSAWFELDLEEKPDLAWKGTKEPKIPLDAGRHLVGWFHCASMEEFPSCRFWNPFIEPEPVDAKTAVILKLISSDERVRLAGVNEVATLNRSHDDIPLIRILAGDPSPQVRLAAARGLVLLGSYNAIRALRCAAQLDGNPEVREFARWAIDLIIVSPDNKMYRNTGACFSGVAFEF